MTTHRTRMMAGRAVSKPPLELPNGDYFCPGCLRIMIGEQWLALRFSQECGGRGNLPCRARTSNYSHQAKVYKRLRKEYYP